MIQQSHSWSSCVCTPLHLTLCDPMAYSPPGSSVYGISQARILEWVALSFSRGSSWPRDQICFSCIGRGVTTEPAIKKNEIMPSAAIWMQLEIIILSEGRKRQTLYDLTYVGHKWNLTMKQKQNQDAENIVFSLLEFFSYIKSELTTKIYWSCHLPVLITFNFLLSCCLRIKSRLFSLANKTTTIVFQTNCSHFPHNY